MKKVIIALIFSAFLFPAMACRNIVKSYCSCKKVRSDTVLIAYNYSSKDKTLQIIHKGAMLNCCLSNITAGYVLKNKTITIEEYERLRELCKCVCPYDITMKIENLSAEKYTLEIGRFLMPVDLINKPAGKKVFYR